MRHFVVVAVAGAVAGVPLSSPMARPRARRTSSSVATVALQVSAGGGETAAGVLGDCDASHAREVAYARSLGLVPST